jgi:oxygen-independent coproporphyrinogen-3 oxidase
MARKGDFTPMDGDTAASLYELTQEMTRSAGIPAYEISNHARTGQASRHNLTYWRYGDYVGIGPGAHGRRSGAATIRHKKPENWMEAVQRNGHGCQSETPLGSQERASEALLMGLRLAEGVNLTRIAALSGVAQTQLLDSDGLARMVKLEMVSAIGNCIAVTPKGMLVLNAILAEIVAV